jgi:putative tricarboxylic transport membrane protein
MSPDPTAKAPPSPDGPDAGGSGRDGRSAAGGVPAAAPVGRAARPAWATARGRAELGLALLLVVVAGVVLAQTAALHVPASTGVAGPRFFPALVGVLLLVAGVLLGVEVLRGRTAEPEAGEDLDPHARTDWPALGLLTAALAVHVLLLLLIGYVLAVAALFAVAARALGSRRVVRDAAVGFLLGLVIYLVFTKGLALTLPRGPLEGLF